MTISGVKSLFERIFRTIPVWCILACMQNSEGSQLNRQLIHAQYLEGNFDSAFAILECKKSCKAIPSLSIADSAFREKHLGVMYVSNPATREKGKRHLWNLLDLEPCAQLVDMFASDGINEIFNKTREEYRIHQASRGMEIQPCANSTTAESNSPPPIPKAEPAPPLWKRKKAWFLGGLAIAVGGGMAAFHFLDEGPNPGATRIPSNSN
jgi:hypothetical protein